jgi:hypothetical protein
MFCPQKPRGAPDRHDRIAKFRKYRQAGARERIVDPETQSIQARVLENGRYAASVYGKEDTAPVTASRRPDCPESYFYGVTAWR